MAELTVRMQYASKSRTMSLALLKLTFPLWGIVGPIVSAAALVTVVATMHSGLNNPWAADTVVRGMGYCLSGLVLALLCLFATRALSHDYIIADKNGLLLPLSLANLRRYWSWNNIKAAKVVPPVAADASKQTLIFVTDKGKHLPLQLSRLQQPEIEQLLLAVEMWAPNCSPDASLLTLKDKLQERAPVAELSYTNMWEDELRRRFCATSFMPLEPGTAIRNGSLRVLRHLALGGLSALYLCQLDDQKLVVVKEAVVPDDSAESVREKAREMFEREANLLMKLNHPNIVKVLDCFADNGRNYMMLDYVNGQDLRQFIKQNGPQKEHVVIEWAIQIANILKYLHEQDPPIIHRDLTPDNLVLRDDGTVVLIDFGAANEFIGNATGTFVGKQSFIAPEQFRGKALVQSDIYAFGCTLFFLLTGNEPEALSTSSPREVNSSINEELDEFVNCCTQMEARDRFQTAAQILPVLRKMAASLLVT